MDNIDISSIIAAPLLAASAAHAELCEATRQFIDSCMNVEGDTRKPILIEFQYDYIENDTTNSTIIRVPLLSILSIPTLGIEQVNVDMTVEVNEITESTPTNNTISRGNRSSRAAATNSNATNTLVQPTIQPLVLGRLSSQNKVSRTTNNSSSFTVSISAKKQEQPEGLSRLLDMLNDAINM